MNFLMKLRLLAHFLRWRATWEKRNTRRAFTIPDNPKFMGPRDAIGLIDDGDVVAVSGMAGNARISLLYWAMKELFQETGHPRGLTVMCTGGQGSRGRVPGTMDEIGIEGLCTRHISAHQETFRPFLRLADAGKIEMQCIPQGVFTQLLDALGRGEDSLVSPIGLGTFLDPRVGSGSSIFDPNAEALIEVEGEQLRYHIPRIDVAMFNAPAVDRRGNVYLKNASLVAETHEITRAAKANGGRVIVNTGLLVDEGYDEIAVHADRIDAIVYDANCEQSFSIPHRKHWPLLTTNSDIPVREAIRRLSFVSRILGVTPRRTPGDEAIARLAAATFAEHGAGSHYVNIGVGLPEEVCRMLFQAGLLDQITAFTETGVIGGLPAPGAFFGVAACPERMVSSAEIFRLIQRKLDITVLGAIEADSQGNVNVSKRGEGPLKYVGPGGFIDIATGARTIIFVAGWTPNGKVQIEDGKIRITAPGKPKFVDRVAEITFSGQQALKSGKKVFFATTVGLFQLTPRGMELRRVMPGIDIQRDIVQACSMDVVLPESGAVPAVDEAVVTGKGFHLTFLEPPEAPA